MVPLPSFFEQVKPEEITHHLVSQVFEISRDGQPLITGGFIGGLCCGMPGITSGFDHNHAHPGLTDCLVRVIHQPLSNPLALICWVNTHHMDLAHIVFGVDLDADPADNHGHPSWRQ